MTRAEKIRRIILYRPNLYMHLKREVPSILVNPDNATDDDISLYNQLVALEAKRDNNNTTFKKNFSF